tara:strand:+ start:974 stop:1258 length:285 start_codon:yes stop_codon:yes gene_type:complete
MELKHLHKEQVIVDDVHAYDYLAMSNDLQESHMLYCDDKLCMQLDINETHVKVFEIAGQEQWTIQEAEMLHILLRLSSQYSVYELMSPTPKKRI